MPVIAAAHRDADLVSIQPTLDGACWLQAAGLRTPVGTKA